MNDLSLEDLDRYLLKRDSKIIHQIWFGIIPNRKEAKKAFEDLRRCRDSWLNNNPSWTYMCWDYEKCKNLIKTHYPQHWEMYNNYDYHIQRCDAVRYFILHRYGGLYADMDYYCGKSWDNTIQDYSHDIYLVETPNKLTSDNVYISNSLMYCKKPGHVFWNTLFIELEMYKTAPLYYSRHMTIMFTTGPGILNRVFNKYRIKYKLRHYPYKLFHPYGLTSDIITLNKNPEVYAIHLGKGSWEKNDSRVWIFIYQEWKLLLFVILILTVPSLIRYILASR